MAVVIGDLGETRPGPILSVPPAKPPGAPPSPTHPSRVREGLRVTLSRVPGYTKKGLLKSPLLFQCPPLENFQRSYDYEFQTYDTVGRVQYLRPGALQLASVRFSTLYVDYDATFALYSGHQVTPPDFARELRAIQSTGTPFWLHAVNPHYWRKPDVHMQAVIASLGVEERAGEVDARYFDLTFTEFKTPVLRRGSSANDREKLPTYVTVDALPEGQRTLYDLAKRYYHATERWRVLAKANGLTTVPPTEDLTVMFAGQARKLRIPALPQQEG